MKKFILIAGICLLSIMLIGMSSAPTKSIPKSVSVFYGYPEQVQKIILDKTKEGYVVKSAAGYIESCRGYGQVFVIMEKY